MNHNKPLGHALTDFKPLRSAEMRLLDACKNGKVAKLGDATPESATDELQVRAAFVRFLLLGGDEHAPVHELGVTVHGAFVEGMLDLRGCNIVANASLVNCRFDSSIYAVDARLDGLLSLEGSHLVNGLVADRLRCSAGVFMRNGFKTSGEVRMLGAQIGGNLDCKGGQFEVDTVDALSLDGAIVRGAVSLRDGFRATGTVSLLGAQIFGSLECPGGQFEVKTGNALLADGVDVRGDIFLNDGFEARGEVRLLGAHIGGDLSCVGGLFKVKKGDALSFDRASVRGDIYLRDGFQATNTVRLTGAQIGGSLDCRGGQFDVKDGYALWADGAHVKGDVALCNGFKATGEVRLQGVQIGGNLDCTGAQFEVNEGYALFADGVEVKGAFHLRVGFRATGEVRLLGAQINGDLNCTGGLFEVRSGKALSADRTKVKGGVSLCDGFKATGEVRLLGAEIGGNLNCNSGRFEAPVGVALSLDHAIVRGAWHLYGFSNSVNVDASHADVAVLVDDTASWAHGSVLDGLCYAALGGRAPTSGAERLRWLDRQSKDHLGITNGGQEFRPQPWRQVQRVLREMGHIEDAKQIGISFEDRLRAIGKLGQSPKGTNVVSAKLKKWVATSAHYTFGKLAGYGYRPIRLVGWMFGVWLACGSAYWFLALPPFSAMAPSDPLVFQNASYTECQPDRSEKPGNWYLCAPLRGEYATFSPLAFSLDVMLPVVDLGQEKTWGAFVPTPKESPWDEFRHVHSGHWARLLIWFETLFGWLSSLLLVAIVSGFSRRNDEG